MRDLSRLPTTEIELRLDRGGLPPAEEEALEAELSDRLTDELLEAVDVPRRPGPGRIRRAAPPPEAQRLVLTPRPPADSSEPSGRSPRRGRVLAGAIAAVVVAAGALGALALADSSSSSSYRTGGSTTSATTAAAATTRPGPEVVPRTGSGGPSGTVRVRWTYSWGSVCSAAVTTSGLDGRADVSCRGASGEVNDTRQDLTLADVYDGLGYVGSNPRDAQSGTLRANFYPEIFMLRSDASGRPVVTQVCDARGVESCAAATMTS
jgi:hypothetical protein